MQIDISCVAELNADPSYDALITEYTLQSSTGVEGPKAEYLMGARSRENYAALENLKMLTLLAARQEERLIGVLVLFHTQNGSNVSMVESMYVLQDCRKTGAGQALLRRAEAYCRNMGDRWLLVQAEPMSRLDRIMAATRKRLFSKVWAIKL